MDKEKFLRLYFEKKETMRTICFIFGVSSATLYKQMKEWGIKRRGK